MIRGYNVHSGLIDAYCDQCSDLVSNINHFSRGMARICPSTRQRGWRGRVRYDNEQSRSTIKSQILPGTTFAQLPSIRKAGYMYMYMYMHLLHTPSISDSHYQPTSPKRDRIGTYQHIRQKKSCVHRAYPGKHQKMAIQGI